MKRRKPARARKNRKASPKPGNPRAAAQRRRQLATHYAARYPSR